MKYVHASDKMNPYLESGDNRVGCFGPCQLLMTSAGLCNNAGLHYYHDHLQPEGKSAWLCQFLWNRTEKVCVFNMPNDKAYKCYYSTHLSKVMPRS